MRSEAAASTDRYLCITAHMLNKVDMLLLLKHLHLDPPAASRQAVVTATVSQADRSHLL